MNNEIKVMQNTKNMRQVNKEFAALRELIVNAETIEQMCERIEKHPYNFKTEITVEGSDCVVSLQSGADARDFSFSMGWERPYAVSGDAHQNRWQILLWKKDLEDPYNKRISANFPTIGKWEINTLLKGRPEGDIPDVIYGASPAYDLNSYSAEILKIEIRAKQ